MSPYFESWPCLATFELWGTNWTECKYWLKLALMAKKPQKTDRINARMPPHVRLGAELLAGKYGVSLSTIMEKAIAEMVKKEGLMEPVEGDLLSLVERLQTMRPGQRLKYLEVHRSDLLSTKDKLWLWGMKRRGEDTDALFFGADEIEQDYEEHYDDYEG